MGWRIGGSGGKGGDAFGEKRWERTGFLSGGRGELVGKGEGGEEGCRDRCKVTR